MAAYDGACGRRGAPYVAAVALTAEAEAERGAPAFPPWIRSLAVYERREEHEFAVSRYG
jgi:hypothetical protein